MVRHVEKLHRKKKKEKLKIGIRVVGVSNKLDGPKAKGRVRVIPTDFAETIKQMRMDLN